MNHVAKVALQEQEAPGIKQLLLQQMMQETLKRENEKIEKPVPDEAGQKVRPKNERDKENPEQQAGHRSGPGSGQPGAEPFEDGPRAPEDDVWAGNIVNVRI
jgi:hypothetical protein